MTYQMDYDGDKPQQAYVSAEAGQTNKSPLRLYAPASPKWIIPSILKTGVTFLVAGTLFFGSEIILPENFKPSTLVGTYDARVNAAVKAAELQQQAKLDTYNAGIKLANDQNLEKYRMTSQAVIGYYGATYDRAKLFAEATTRIQQQYVATRLQQAQTAQSTDMSVANWSRLWGRFQNYVTPGSGDAAMQYSDNLRNELNDELTRAAADGVVIKVDGWNTDLPSPQAVQAELERLKPVPLPELPRIGEDAPRQDFSSKQTH